MNTPAKQLARLKVTYPRWRFERRGDLWLAWGRYNQLFLRATDAGQLEAAVIQADPTAR
jgi:hypothetical protein